LVKFKSIDLAMFEFNFKILKDKLFKLYANRDFITREDILNENLNISNEMFNKLDLDGDGKLTYSEYQLASNMKNEKIVYFHFLNVKCIF